jgi:ribosomal protein L18E
MQAGNPAKKQEHRMTGNARRAEAECHAFWRKIAARLRQSKVKQHEKS